jgi:hypothetical protein
MALSEIPRSLAIWEVGFSQSNFSSVAAEGQTIFAGRGGEGFRLDIIDAFEGSSLGRGACGRADTCENVLAGSDSVGRFL